MTAALPRDISYCYGAKCKKKKQCERWLGNLNVQGPEGAWISICDFSLQEETCDCFIPLMEEKEKAS
jgi:hypothetical protein